MSALTTRDDYLAAVTTARTAAEAYYVTDDTGTTEQRQGDASQPRDLQNDVET